MQLCLCFAKFGRGCRACSRTWAWAAFVRVGDMGSVAITSLILVTCTKSQSRRRGRGNVAIPNGFLSFHGLLWSSSQDSKLPKPRFTCTSPSSDRQSAGLFPSCRPTATEPLIWTVGKIKPISNYYRAKIKQIKADFPFGRSARKARMRGLVVFSLFAISALGQAFNPVTKERAPESILQLPEGVRRDLDNRQCVVPKYLGDVGTKDTSLYEGPFPVWHFR